MPDIHEYNEKFRKLLLAALLLIFSGVANAQSLPALIPYRKGALCGYCDSNKNVLIAPQWQDVEFFNSGTARVKIGYAHYALIDTNGKYLVPPEWHWIGEYSGHILNVHDETGRYGCIDKIGKLTIPFLHDSAIWEYRRDFDDASSYTDVGSGSMIGNAPKMVKYLRGSDFREWQNWRNGMVVVKNGKYGIIDIHNNVMIPLQYDGICLDNYRYDVEYIMININGKWGLIDTNNQVVLPAQYYDVDFKIARGRLFVVKNARGRYGVVDKNNKTIIPFKYDYIKYSEYFSAGSRISDGFMALSGSFYQWYKADGKPVFRTRCNTMFVNPDASFTLFDFRYYSATGIPKLIGRPVLIDSTGKKMITGPYDDFCVTDSTIWGYRCPESQESEYQVISKKTYMPLTGWIKDSGEFYGRAASLLETSDMPNTYRREGRIYRGSRFGKGHGKRKSSDPRQEATQSVEEQLDPEITKELPHKWRGRYKLVNNDTTDNLYLIITDDTLYGVADNSLHLLLLPQKRQLRCAFRWNGEVFGVAQYPAFTVNRPGDFINILLFSRYQFDNNYGELVDNKGKVVSNFKDRCINSMVSYEGVYPVAIDERNRISGKFYVFDTAFNEGIVNTDNQILYPQVSFKYPLMYALAGSVFFVVKERQFSMVDIHNKEIFAGLQIYRLNPKYPEGEGANANCLLYEIEHYTPNSNLNSTFLIGRNGTVYADSLIFR